MLAVRRTLTEILLETTNEEIAAIAGETLKAHRAKGTLYITLKFTPKTDLLQRTRVCVFV